MTENADRRNENWLDQLSAAVSASNRPNDEQQQDEERAGLASTFAALPSWPWAMSGIGLCLALLTLEPGASEPGTQRQSRQATAPQVQGWRATATSSATWPDEIPAFGYRGVELPMPLPAETTTEATATAAVVPARTMPNEPASAVVTASPSAEPAAAEQQIASTATDLPTASPLPPLPITVIETAIEPTAAVAPPPDFVPPLPGWTSDNSFAAPPMIVAVVAKPAPIAKPQPLPVEKAAATPRRSSTQSPRRERPAARVKQTVESEASAEPSWRDKILLNARD